MKNIFYALPVIFILASCSAPKSPDFKTIKNARVTKAKGNIYTVTADAVYTNPNSIGGNLVALEMDITVDDVKVTHISQTKSAVIQPETDFVVPITFDVDIKNVVKKDKNAVSAFLNKLLKDEVDVNYSGHLTVQFLSRQFEVPVDYTEGVSLGLNYN